MKNQTPIQSTNNLLKENLAPILDLIKKSLLFLKTNFKKLVLITCVALLPFIMFQLLLNELIIFYKSGELQNTNILILSLSFFAISIIPVLNSIISIIQQIALIYFIDKTEKKEETKISESYSANKRYLLSYIWISLLIFFIALAGGGGIMLCIFLSSLFKTIFSSKYILTVLFALNFIASFVIFVYLIYLIICFIFSHFILIYENIRGWEALKKSKAIIKNYWWAVTIRLIILNVILIILSLAIIPLKLLPGEIISYYLSIIYYVALTILAIPYAIIYTFFIYKDLKRIKDGSL